MDVNRPTKKKKKKTIRLNWEVVVFSDSRSYPEQSKKKKNVFIYKKCHAQSEISFSNSTWTSYFIVKYINSYNPASPSFHSFIAIAVYVVGFVVVVVLVVVEVVLVVFVVVACYCCSFSAPIRFISVAFGEFYDDEFKIPRPP